MDIALGNYTLEVSGEMNQLKIRVIDQSEASQDVVTQFLPLDGHVKNSVDGCVQFCIKKLTDKSNSKSSAE